MGISLPWNPSGYATGGVSGLVKMLRVKRRQLNGRADQQRPAYLLPQNP